MRKRCRNKLDVKAVARGTTPAAKVFTDRKKKLNREFCRRPTGEG